MFKKKKYDFYLAGGMRGYKDLNKPLFTLVAHLLREKGFTVWSPAEHGSYLDSSFAKCMTRDLDAIINKCDGIALLPGWRNSLGANTEAFTAFVCDKKAVKIIINENKIGKEPYSINCPRCHASIEILKTGKIDLCSFCGKMWLSKSLIDNIELIPFNLTRYILPYEHKLQSHQFNPHTSE